MSEEHCLGCGTELSFIDDDPNGDKNCTCARCRAEEDHDFDREPDVIFDRAGRMVEPTKEEEQLKELILEGKALHTKIEDLAKAFGDSVDFKVEAWLDASKFKAYETYHQLEQASVSIMRQKKQKAR